MKQVAALILSGALLAACASTGGQGGTGGGISSQTTGAVVGGVLGGFLGSQFGEGGGKTAAAIGGALAGAWLGSKVAQGLSAQDRTYYDSAATKASSAPVGQTIAWNNPQSGAYGTITPMRDGRTQTGEYCREYQQTIVVGGKTERAFGTACQQPDGSWRVVN
jgi:surface antigen